MSFFGQQNNNQQPASGFGGFGSNSNNNAASGTLASRGPPLEYFSLLIPLECLNCCKSNPASSMF